MQKADRISRRLKLHQLNVLLSIAQHGSMAKAASHLGISQPVVSRTIADLENLLGVRLLDRSRQGVTPTIHGQTLLKRAAEIFDGIKTCVSEIEFLSDPTRGHLRIGSFESMNAMILPAILYQFTRQYPKVNCEIVLADPEMLYQRELRERRVELVVSVQSTRTLDNDMDVITLCRHRLCIVAGARSRWAQRRKLALSDLTNERWCLPPLGHPVRAAVIDAFRQIGMQPPVSNVTIASPQFTANLVAKGEFLGVLDTVLLAANLASSQLKALPIELPAPTFASSIVTLTNRTLSPVARLFIDVAREVTKPLAREK